MQWRSSWILWKWTQGKTTENLNQRVNGALDASNRYAKGHVRAWPNAGEQAPMNQSTLQDFESSGVECEDCGKTFSTEGGKNKHKGMMHGTAMVEIECEYCGDTFERKPSQKGRSKYCSKSCMQQWQSENRSGRNSPTWEGGKTKTVCEHCGTKFKADPCDLENGRGRFCSPKCNHEWQKTQTGSNNPLWRGGKDLTDALRKSLGGWRQAREKAREMAANECEMCGSKSSGTGKSHDVHHIIPVNAGGVNNVENLMCLCRSCHMRVEAWTRDLPEIKPIAEMSEVD